MYVYKMGFFDQELLTLFFVFSLEENKGMKPAQASKYVNRLGLRYKTFFEMTKAFIVVRYTSTRYFSHLSESKGDSCLFEIQVSSVQ